MGAAKKTDNLPTKQGDLVVNPISKKDEQNLFNLKSETTDLGKYDSLRFKVMSSVLNEEYDKAIKELKDFLEEPSDYPEFKDRVTRFIHHSVDLIFAIKAKRNFPGISSLTRAKQQELREKFKEHFKELQQILMRVEKVETDLRIADVRSTIYVVQALWLAAIAIVGLAFTLEFFKGLAETGFIVFDDVITNMTETLFKFIGL